MLFVNEFHVGLGHRAKRFYNKYDIHNLQDIIVLCYKIRSTL